MKMNDKAIEKINSLTATIIADPIEYGSLKRAVDELHDFLILLSKLNMEATVNSEDLVLPSGKAIAPRWAAMCVVDLLRTRNFMKGVYQAVSDLRKVKQDGPIHIVYAGTGPFATLVLPLLHRFSSEEVKFSFLEANTISIDSLRNVFQQLDATDYIAELFHCDAANFDLTELGKKADILLVECLQHALLKEPQVAITCNLISQMKKEAVLIPEKIEVYVGLLNMTKRQEELESGRLEGYSEDWYLNSECIFQLDKNIRDTINGRFSLQEYEFPEVSTLFSDEERIQFDTISIQTEIKIYESLCLSLNESGLTAPYMIASFDRNPEITGLTTQYEIGVSPGFRIAFQRGQSPNET